MSEVGLVTHSAADVASTRHSTMQRLINSKCSPLKCCDARVRRVASGINVSGTGRVGEAGYLSRGHALDEETLATENRCLYAVTRLYYTQTLTGGNTF